VALSAAHQFEVGVGVDESREEYSARQVDHSRRDTLQKAHFVGRAHADDPAVPDRDRLGHLVGVGERAYLAAGENEVR
jgi:hypothetical protein